MAKLELEVRKLPVLTITDDPITSRVHWAETDIKKLAALIEQLMDKVAHLERKVAALEGKAISEPKIKNGTTVRIREVGMAKGMPCFVTTLLAQTAKYYLCNGANIKKGDPRLHLEPCPDCPDSQSE